MAKGARQTWRSVVQVMALVWATSRKLTLALAATMENTGQLYAYDADRMRLRPIFERLKRAGVRNGQVLDPGDAKALAELEGKMDRVIVDALAMILPRRMDLMSAFHQSRPHLLAFAGMTRVG